MTPPLRSRLVALTMVGALGATACSVSFDEAVTEVVDVAEATDAAEALGDPGDCVTVDMAVSSEKIALLTELARDFNDSEAADVNGRCTFVRPHRKASGAAMSALAEGWDPAVDGPLPVVWSPAASTWGPVLNQRLAEQGEPEMVGDGQPFMVTPLVIAMPQPMAEALGWPDAEIGWSTILDLANGSQDWSDFGRPEWGAFRLGKTNPNFSTSGLAALIAQSYAAVDKTTDLSREDITNPGAVQFARDIESAVVHYGPTTLTFLNNWYSADQRGTALTYASAAAVEEKSVIDYNLGNPDGVLEPGEEARPPRIPLVSIYPTEGTLYSDNPFFVLDAEWVGDEQKAGAAAFEAFVQTEDNQAKVLEFGFRPGNPAVPLTEPLVAANGVDVDQPQTLLEVPDPAVMTALIDQWGDNRKEARVTLLVDVSGSMGDFADPSTGATKLDLAQQAAIEALDEFKDDDQVSLRVFSTNVGDTSSLEVVPFGRMGDIRPELEARIAALIPLEGTPLYEAVQETYDDMISDYDPAVINAVVLLSDGVNDDLDRSNDRADLAALLDAMQTGSEGQASRPVRVFPIGYGGDADLATLGQIAEATSAAVYDASDPASIDRVFTQVLSNF